MLGRRGSITSCISRHGADMVTKPTGNPTGRPRIALRDDVQGRLITYFEAQAFLGERQGLSRRGIALALMAALHGEVVNTEGNIGSLNNGPSDLLFKSLKFVGNAQSFEPRNKSALHATADNFMRKCRNLAESLYTDSEDGRWYVSMVQAWILVLDGSQYDVARQIAQIAAHLVGEDTLFATVMSPILAHRFGYGPAPHFRLPDFSPHA